MTRPGLCILRGLLALISRISSQNNITKFVVRVLCHHSSAEIQQNPGSFFSGFQLGNFWMGLPLVQDKKRSVPFAALCPRLFRSVQLQ